MKKHWCALALLFAAACESQGSGNEAASSEELVANTSKYSIAPWAGSAYGNFYGLVDRQPVRICVELEPGVTMSRFSVENDLAWATWEWVHAVQPVSSASLRNDVAFTCEQIANDNVPLYDLIVVVHPGPGRAWSHGEIIDLYQDEPLFYETVLHEMGHQFGMADTYIDIPGAGCQSNQPSSVMCEGAFTTLQPDDVSGARQSFRVVQPDLYTSLNRPIVAEGSGRCIDAANFGTANKTFVQLWDCPYGPLSNQVWRYDVGTKQLIGEHSNKCLDVAGASTANGAAVWLWDCYGGLNQQWEPHADGTIRSVATGKCLEVADYGTQNGSAIQMWDCHGGANQIWH